MEDYSRTPNERNKNQESREHSTTGMLGEERKQDGKV